MGSGSNNFAGGPLGVIVNGATLISTFSVLDLESWIWEKEHLVSDADSEHAQPSGKPCPSHLAGAVTESLKG